MYKKYIKFKKNSFLQSSVKGTNTTRFACIPRLATAFVIAVTVAVAAMYDGDATCVEGEPLPHHHHRQAVSPARIHLDHP